MPAPPPYGVSSTWPAFRGVVARRSIASSAWPSPSALRTCRCSRNQSNHPGNSVNMSIFIRVRSLSEEVLVDADLAPLDRADRIRDERHEAPVVELEHRAGGAVEDARHASPARHRGPHQVGCEPLALAQLRLDQQDLAAQRPRVV